MTSENWLRGGIASFIQMSANIMVAKAMTLGYSGPIGGLISVQPLVATLLNAVYLGESPNNL
jgi:hypothetical protein